MKVQVVILWQIYAPSLSPYNASLAAVSQSSGGTDVLESPAKRSRHRESGFDPQWSVDIPCSLCRKHYRRCKKVAVGRASCVDMPYLAGKA